MTHLSFPLDTTHLRLRSPLIVPWIMALFAPDAKQGPDGNGPRGVPPETNGLTAEDRSRMIARMRRLSGSPAEQHGKV